MVVTNACGQLFYVTLGGNKGNVTTLFNEELYFGFAGTMPPEMDDGRCFINTVVQFEANG